MLPTLALKVYFGWSDHVTGTATAPSWGPLGSLSVENCLLRRTGHCSTGPCSAGATCDPQPRASNGDISVVGASQVPLERLLLETDAPDGLPRITDADLAARSARCVLPCPCHQSRSLSISTHVPQHTADAGVCVEVCFRTTYCRNAQHLATTRGARDSDLCYITIEERCPARVSKVLNISAPLDRFCFCSVTHKTSSSRHLAHTSDLASSREYLMLCCCWTV